MDIMNLQEGAMVCSISQQKSLFKGLSYSIYLIIRYTSIANNKSKYLHSTYYLLNEYFIHMNSFNSQSSPEWWVVLWFPFCRKGNQGTEWLGALSQVAQVSGRRARLFHSSSIQ